jgi:hypothetical protein
MSEGRELYCPWCGAEVGMMGHGEGNECEAKRRGEEPRFAGPVDVSERIAAAKAEEREACVPGRKGRADSSGRA